MTTKHVRFDEEEFLSSNKRKENATKKLQQKSTVEEENWTKQQIAVLHDITDDETGRVALEVSVRQNSTKVMIQQEEASTQMASVPK